MKTRKFVWASSVAMMLVVAGCGDIKVKHTSGEDSETVDKKVDKDYKEALKKISDDTYEGAVGKTKAIVDYAESYEKAYKSPFQEKDAAFNDLLQSVTDGTYTKGTAYEKAMALFTSYFLQSSKSTPFDDGSNELAFSESYYQAVRSSIRIDEAKRQDDDATKDAEKAELKKHQQAMAKASKKLTSKEGKKVSKALNEKEQKTTTAAGQTESTPTTSGKAAKPEVKATAEKVTVQTTTPQSTPASGDHERYHDITGYVYVNTGKANAGLFLRSGPGTNYNKVLSTSLKNGEPLTLFGRQGNWYNVYVDNYGVLGWVHSSYVSSTAPASATTSTNSGSTSSGTLTVHTGSSTLTLRSDASKSSTKLGAIKSGATVEPYNYVDGWYYVYVPSLGKYGWVSAEFVY